MLDPEELLRRAMELPAEARAALAGSLLRSLEGPVDEDAESAWSQELQRRIDDVESGRIRPVGHDIARRQITG